VSPSDYYVLIQSKLDFSFAFGVVLHKIEACNFVLADLQCLWRYSITQHYRSVLRFYHLKINGAHSLDFDPLA
jgi:hypothetical protein